MNNDSLYHVFTFLDARTLIVCTPVNKKWNNFSYDDILWKNLCMRDFNEDIQSIKKDTYYQTYIFCYRMNKLIVHFKMDCSISQIYGLDRIFSNNTSLTSIPKEIGQLTNLKTLALDKNQLASIPNEIEQLTCEIIR